MRRAMTLAAVAGFGLALSACASDDPNAPVITSPPPEVPPAETASAPSSSGGLVFGGAGPGAKFSAPKPTEGSPDLNTVPTQAPMPPSTREERAEAIEGLIADRTNARYSEQGGRTLPVAVRPLSEVPETRANLAEKVDAPAPARPSAAEIAAAEVQFPEPPAIVGDVGPRTQGGAGRSIAGNVSPVAAGGGTTAQTGGSTGGFRTLAEYQTPSGAKPTLTGNLALIGGNLTASDRNILNTTARQQIDDKGAVRVIGRGAGGMERAVIAARELQRLGVPRDSLFIGAETNAGPTEVYLDRLK